MQIIIYDFEVFKHDWLAVFKNHETGEYQYLHNDAIMLHDILNSDDIFVGFNNKHYDQYVAKAAINYPPEVVKEVNDYIIGGGQGWECPVLEGTYFKFSNVDVMDDMQKGQSLKSIEGHLYMDIKETEVDFNLDRPLTKEEAVLTIKYCKHDVDATEKIFDLRKDYFNNKIKIAKLAGLNEVKAMGMTNAKLTAAMLKANKQDHDDEREYVYPENLKREYIPNEIFAYFDRLHDESLTDEEVFKGDKLNFKIGECEVVIGMGGIHGAIPHYMWKEEDATE